MHKNTHMLKARGCMIRTEYCVTVLRLSKLIIHFSNIYANSSNLYSHIFCIAVLAGYSAGDGLNLYRIPGSLTPEILNIASTSNVNVPGMWVFRLDEDDIVFRCSDNKFGKLAPEMHYLYIIYMYTWMSKGYKNPAFLYLSSSLQLC